MHEKSTEEQPAQSHPLKRSENCWMPSKYRESSKRLPSNDEQVQQKVKALLNKLSPTNFDSISAQIFEYAKDAHTLKTVVNMTFEKACDEPCFATLWAKLCRKMYDEVNSNKFVDPAILDRGGHPINGVLLFRQYLVKRCQETYERGWSSATYEMLSDEYYQATKAKRRALGLITFIGELFKQEILSLKIVQTCLQGLASAPESINDDVVETICKLLETVGMVMDVQPHSKAWLDAYMQRVQGLMNTCQELSTRVKFKVMDLNDLRKRRWVTNRKM
ncbi:armadillo-type protein [Fennellomyces sp. T-0311]|nr:armadillo-type protein [Fennellomyces sp. T-0311]